MNFNEKLIELRKSKGLSQEQLGNELDVTRQTVSKWELGLTTPEMNKLIELSRLFDISIDELVGNDVSSSAAVSLFGFRDIHYEYKSKKTLFNKMDGSPRPLRSGMDSPSAARLTDI